MQLYAVVAGWTLFSYVVPGFLLGAAWGLIYELQSRLATSYPEHASQLWARIHNIIRKV